MRLSTRLARVERVMRPQRDPGDYMIDPVLQEATPAEHAEILRLFETMYGSDDPDHWRLINDPPASHAAHQFVTLWAGIAERAATKGAQHGN